MVNMPKVPGRTYDASWPVQAVQTAEAAKHFTLLPAASETMSHYVTGWIASSAAKTFSILRRSYPAMGATSVFTLADNSAAVKMGTSDFLITFWVKLTASAKNNDLFSKSSSGNYYAMACGASGTPAFLIVDGSTNSALVASATNICDGQWHFIAIHGDRSLAAGLGIYVDGGDREVTAAQDLSSVGSVTGGDDDLVFGPVSGGFDIACFGMYVSGANITTAVAEAEIVSLYNGGIGKKFTGTETYLSYAANFDEGTGSTCYPVNVAGVTGVGTWTVSVAAPTWTTGGPPFNGDEVPSLVGLSALRLQTMAHAIKIGAGMPLQAIVSDAVNLTLFGATEQT